MVQDLVVVICTISIYGAVMGLVHHSLGRKKYLPWGSYTFLLGSRMFGFATVLSVRKIFALGQLHLSAWEQNVWICDCFVCNLLCTVAAVKVYCPATPPLLLYGTGFGGGHMYYFYCCYGARASFIR
jgi:hypothetical protein